MKASRLLALSLALILPVARAQTTPPPAGGQPLLPDQLGTARLVTNEANKDAGRFTAVDVTGPGFARAARI